MLMEYSHKFYFSDHLNFFVHKDKIGLHMEKDVPHKEKRVAKDPPYR